LSIAHPEQLNHRIREGKAPIGRALSGVPIGRPLKQTEPDKFLSFRSAWCSANEQMIQLNAHAGSLAAPSQPNQSASIASASRFPLEGREPGMREPGMIDKHQRVAALRCLRQFGLKS
jgi:hypothetical protein